LSSACAVAPRHHEVKKRARAKERYNSERSGVEGALGVVRVEKKHRR